MVWQCAVTHGSGKEPYDRTQFPIFLKDNDWAQREIDRMLQSVSPYAKQVIKSMQPYRRPEEAQTHALWILHSLWNIDKHRTLTELPLSIEFKAPSSPEVKHGFFQNGGIEVSMPIRLAREHHFKPDVTVSIGFERAGPVKASTVSVLRVAYEGIRNQVLPVLADFAPERRGGEYLPVDEEGRLIFPEPEAGHAPPPSDDASSAKLVK